METWLALAVRSIFGVDADLLGIFVSSVALLASVVGGVWLYRYRQEVEACSNRFLVQGIQSLYGSLTTLLSIHLQNYQVAMYIMKSIKLYDLAHPLAPEPEDIPGFVGLKLESFPIDSLLLVQELLGDKLVLEWMMKAIADITLEAKELEFQMRQPTASLFRNKNDQTIVVRKDELLKGLDLVVDAWNTRCSTHFALRDRLHDLDNHVSRKRPWKIAGYYAIRRRKEVAAIREQMKVGWDRVQEADRETAEVLRTGGYTA